MYPGYGFICTTFRCTPSLSSLTISSLEFARLNEPMIVAGFIVLECNCDVDTCYMSCLGFKWFVKSTPPGMTWTHPHLWFQMISVFNPKHRSGMLTTSTTSRRPSVYFFRGDWQIVLAHWRQWMLIHVFQLQLTIYSPLRKTVSQFPTWLVWRSRALLDTLIFNAEMVWSSCCDVSTSWLWMCLGLWLWWLLWMLLRFRLQMPSCK